MSNMDPDFNMIRRAKNRRNLVILGAIAFVPLFLAYVIFFFVPQLIPSGMTNQGQLISPPLRVSDIDDEAIGRAASGKWSFLVVVQASCDASCENAMYLSRQINTAVGKDSDRVQHLLVVRSLDALELLSEKLADFPDMQVFVDPKQATEALLLPVVPAHDLAGVIFLIDPHGNIMLYFDETLDGKAIMKDLKHLLKLSNIG